MHPIKQGRLGKCLPRRHQLSLVTMSENKAYQAIESWPTAHRKLNSPTPGLVLKERTMAQSEHGQTDL